MMPSVRPRISWLPVEDLSHTPACNALSRSVSRRAIAMMLATASSTTERVLEYGALNTAMPRSAAASSAIWFVPMQNAPTATRSGRASRTRGVTSVLDLMPSRSTPSSASTSSSSSSADDMLVTSMPAASRMAGARGCRFSRSRALTAPLSQEPAAVPRTGPRTGQGTPGLVSVAAEDHDGSPAAGSAGRTRAQEARDGYLPDGVRRQRHRGDRDVPGRGRRAARGRLDDPVPGDRGVPARAGRARALPGAGRLLTARPMPDGSQTRADRRSLLAQLSAPLREYLRTEAGGAGVLLAAAVLALLWANSPWSDSYESLWSTRLSISLDRATMSMTLEEWVNEGLMVLFFFVIGLEVRREFAVGELTERRRVVVPALAGLAGTVVPALLYLAVDHGGASGHAWGVVVGTDTAFLLGALALVGPEFSTQLRIFLLTLTVIDDLVAVTVIGAVYSGDIHPGPLLVMLVCLAALVVCSRAGVWRAAPYVLLMVVTWFAAVESGVHPSIAGMVGGLLVAAHPPAREEVEGAVSRFRAFRQSPLVEVGRSAREGVARAISVNERLQSVLHPWTSYVVVPLFAVANAGVDLRHGVLRDSLTSSLTWGVVLALVVGKTIGIWGTAMGAVRLRLGRLPQGVGPGHVLGGAALSGIGFTVSLLIAGLAFDDRTLRDEATVGVLIAAVLATAHGRLQFWLAARLRGEGDADLPRFLDRPVVAGYDFIRGPVDAPMTLVEYGDFECPFCAKATGAARELRIRFGDDMRYVFRHLPLPDVHPHAELAARAAVSAGSQGKFWEMHDLLFRHQDELEFEDLVGYAGELELDVEQFVRGIDDERTARRIRTDVASAEASGARGTPTFFVAERRHTGPYDAETLAAELLASRDRRATLRD